jgi:DNA-binding NarL/FixJ family response regulator
MYAEQSFLKTAKEIGADGYLLKDTDSYEMVEAIKKIGEGQKVFDPRLNESQVNLHHEDHFVKQYSLSKREIEVIGFIKQSLNTEQIADKMCISYETVKSHRKNIFLKLGFNKSSELVQFAIEHGI